MRGKSVTLNKMEVTYPNGFKAVHPTDLVIKAGEFFSILGPSGCGKTTVLRAVSGFVDPSAGQILIGDTDQQGKGPNIRETALIFQNLALFPLMSVWENVAFGLEARGATKRDRREKAEALLDLVALTDQANKKPSELSGGQRQRVAIARALAVDPSVLLLDEPLSALDLKLRQHMRAELRSIQKKTGVTFIYITHDQGEALTMSDRIAVMNAGRIEQVGSADQVYSNPVSAFSASFVGETNQFAGRISDRRGDTALIDTPHGQFGGLNPSGLAVGEDAILFVRPENISASAAENALTTRLSRRDLEGPFVNLFMKTQSGADVAMHIPNTTETACVLGAEMKIGFASGAATILPRGVVARTGRDVAAE